MTAPPTVLDFAYFLTTKPPGSRAFVHGALGDSYGGRDNLLLPPLEIWCSSDTCGGTRLHDAVTHGRSGDGRGLGAIVNLRTPVSTVLEYVCRNCRASRKYLAILAMRFPPEKLSPELRDKHLALITKFGEHPPYGPPVPPRVNKILGPDRDVFFKGMRSESQGLGIGAFGYYRRVLETQKTRLFEQIAQVADRSRLGEDVVTRLRVAAKEDQFSKSVDLARDAVPESLFINGNNPLTLLHRALSSGLHARDDEECLRAARDIRIVLVEIADRVSRVLEDNRELAEAVKRLAVQEKPISD